MKPVRTQQKYKCDFCKKRSVKHVIAKHESRCFRNPNRFCDACQNTGKLTPDRVNGYEVEQPCIYCQSFDRNKLKEIEEWERQHQVEEVKNSIDDIINMI